MIAEKGYHPGLVLIFATTVVMYGFLATWLVVLCATLSVMVVFAVGIWPRRSHALGFLAYICAAGVFYAALGFYVMNLDVLYVVESFVRLSLVVLLGLWLLASVPSTDLFLLLHKWRLSMAGLAILVALTSFAAVRADIATIHRVQSQALRLRHHRRRDLWLDMLSSAVILLLKRATEIDKAYVVRQLGRDPNQIRPPLSWESSWRNILLGILTVSLLILAVIELL